MHIFDFAPNEACEFRLHSKLHNIMLVATELHVILRKFCVLSWMHDNK